MLSISLHATIHSINQSTIHPTMFDFLSLQPYLIAHLVAWHMCHGICNSSASYVGRLFLHMQNTHKEMVRNLAALSNRIVFV